MLGPHLAAVLIQKVRERRGMRTKARKRTEETLVAENCSPGPLAPQPYTNMIYFLLFVSKS